MEQRYDQAPPEAITRSIPSFDGIKGVLRACEDQTAQFQWIDLLYAVAAKLDMHPDEACKPINSAILRGLTLYFPSVQSLPEDREILIQTHTGVGILVVWAHLVLGLDVLVRHPNSWKEDPKTGQATPEEVFFGKSPATVTIDCTLGLEECVILIEAATSEHLFSIEPEPDQDSVISSIVKKPAKGIGMKFLESSWMRMAKHSRGNDGKAACLHEMVLISTALAIRFSKCLHIKDGQSLVQFFGFHC
jgi:hypothetical protein